MWVQFRDEAGSDAGFDTHGADEFRVQADAVRFCRRGSDVGRIPGGDPQRILEEILRFLTLGHPVLDVRPIQGKTGVPR